MSLRTVPYGYMVCDGKYTINETESNVINEIFRLYIEGSTLNKIAETLTKANVEYWQGKSNWNKNTVNRIITNEKYKGISVFPKLIDEEIFTVANKKKAAYGSAQKVLPEDIKCIKEICRCGKCGARYKRINTWGTREKWICAEGCHCTNYIDDITLKSAVMNILSKTINEPQILDSEPCSRYLPCNDVMKIEREIDRFMESPQNNYKLLIDEIINLGSVVYENCEFDAAEITELLKAKLSEIKSVASLNKSIFDEYINEIRIYPNGNISIIYINGKEIFMNGGSQCGNSNETGYEDRS